MKTIFNKLRFALLLGFIAIGMTALAQNIANIEKMSISTQMILNEIENGVSLDIKPDLRGNGLTFTIDSEKQYRTVARPVSINGETFISAFVRVNNESEINNLKALGVQIECIFDNGLLTALIPVDKIHEIAALDGVKKINAATLMKPLTDKTREKTNVDDVLTQSPDAIAAGLDKVYDGSGVILGVIDDGIDYQHIAFKDKDGNNRISRIYNFTYTQTDNYGYPTDPTVTDWTGTGTMPTTDDNTADHGTHTSSIAGGSSVIVNGTNVSVTDNHAHATYGGMAPGAELYLAGIKGLYNTYIANAFQKMYNYATAQGKPLVVSNSWGSQIGPHDGTGSFAEITHNYFSDSNPNNICLFAAGNEAGTADASEGGGFHISGNASSANPLGTILRCSVSSSYDNGLFYMGELASAWSTSNMGCTIYVLNTSTGAIETTVNVNPTTQGAAVTGLSNYYSGTLYAYKDYLNSENKTQILLYASGTNGYMQSQGYYQSNGMYRSNYTLAVEFYPINGSADIDVWAVSDYSYFTNYLTTNGHNWTNGSDDMSVDDEVTYPDVISVGAYNSKTSFVNYQGSTYGANSYILNDITYFSSYATPEESPTGVQYPWITAPGAIIVSAVNHNHTSSVDDDSYYGSTSLVVNSSTNPYAIMQGTSMACPAAAGIVALWLQAAQELDKDLTTTDIKNIMAETAIHDQWTNGTNASHFGNGKINALGGIQYILEHYSSTDPTIRVSATTASFDGEPGNTYTKTITVTGSNLTGDIIATLNDQNGVYSINPTNLGNGGELVITFAPNDEGEFSATITLTSPGAEPVTITINGIALIHTSTLTSNVIAVPVYQSEAEVDYSTYVFSEGEVLGDVNMSLAYPSGAAPGEVKVLAKNDEHILNYELHHKVGNGNWTYPNGNAVATANHVGNSYVVNDNTFTFPQDATEMWITMNDSQLNTAMTTYYIPVTVAKSIVENGSQDNTYGAPVVVSTSDGIDLEVSIGGYKSASKDKYGNYTGIWEGPNGINYCVYMPQILVVSQQLGTLRPYMYRAWLLPNDDITYYNFAHDSQTGFYGTTSINDLPKLLAERTIEDVSNPTHVLLPEELGDTYEGMNTFGAPVNILDATDNPNNPGIVIAVRVYYQSADEENGHMLRSNRDGGYGFGEGRGSGNGIPTGVNELFGFGKQVVDVQYVNALDMQSREPFDGLNIVVTRYSDGSITTTKVVK